MSVRAQPTARSPWTAALLMVVVCTSACESSTVPRLNIRAAPTTASAIVGKVSGTGAAVQVTCYTRGEAIGGQTLWYRISQPHPGYVTAYYIHSDSDILASSHPC